MPVFCQWSLLSEKITATAYTLDTLTAANDVGTLAAANDFDTPAAANEFNLLVAINAFETLTKKFRRFGVKNELIFEKYYISSK